MIREYWELGRAWSNEKFPWMLPSSEDGDGDSCAPYVWCGENHAIVVGLSNGVMAAIVSTIPRQEPGRAHSTCNDANSLGEFDILDRRTGFLLLPYSRPELLFTVLVCCGREAPLMSGVTMGGGLRMKVGVE